MVVPQEPGPGGPDDRRRRPCPGSGCPRRAVHRGGAKLRTQPAILPGEHELEDRQLLRLFVHHQLEAVRQQCPQHHPERILAVEEAPVDGTSRSGLARMSKRSEAIQSGPPSSWKLWI